MVIMHFKKKYRYETAGYFYSKFIQVVESISARNHKL